MNQLETADWEQCVDGLFSSVGYENRLADALGAFRKFVGAERATFLLVNNNSGGGSAHVASCNVPLGALVEYHSHYCVHDVWANEVWRRGGWRLGAVYTGSELCDRRTLRASYFWKDFLVRWGTADVLAGVVQLPSQSEAGAFVSFHRTEELRPFGAFERTVLARLTPHLRRALRLHMRLAPELALGSTLHEVFRSIETPMMFVSRSGALVDPNDALSRLLQGPNPPLRVSRGLVEYRDRHRWRPIADAVRQLEAAPEQRVDLFTVHDHGKVAKIRLRAVRQALTDRLAKHHGLAVCTLEAGDAWSAQSLKLRFQLTDTEVHIAQLLTAGVSPQDIADRLKIAVSTVRSHLAHLFARTGTRRQSELVTKLMSPG